MQPILRPEFAGYPCRRLPRDDLSQLGAGGASLAPNYFDRPVVDMTGLKGVYDLTLEWITFGESMSGEPGPTIFAAVQQLGLKLEGRKQPMEVVVIDHCEAEPIEN